MLDWMVPLAQMGTEALAAVSGLAKGYLSEIGNTNRYGFYAVPAALAWGGYVGWQAFDARRTREAKERAEEAGLAEPPSLHPVIDPAKCIGCGACVNACPEGRVIGLIGGKAELIEPASCIGHGACKTACPADAVSLVFGTATRGIEIPSVTPDFESNVPGLYIAGELGGMGLIANAIEQGRQAVAAIARLDAPARRPKGLLDVAIIGAGPAGISAGLAARERRLQAVILEQHSLGGTVAHYPRGKIVMTRPANLPLHGRVRYRRVRKERLLDLWTHVVRRHRLDIRDNERVIELERREGGFKVSTLHGDYYARTVLLATGRRGSPRRLDVPGEDLSKVVYSLIEPAQYRGQRVLVVGGGDSALETAAALAVAGGAVTLSYRGAAFNRARPAIRARFERLRDAGRISVLMESGVLAIHPTLVEIDWGGRTQQLPNDAVIVCAGGVLPGDFLRAIGVEVDTKYGTP